MRAQLAGVLLALTATAASAHPLAPCVLELHEAGSGQVAVGWKTPLLRPRGAELSPVLPARCQAIGQQTTSEEGGGIWTRWTVDCGPGGLVGQEIGVGGPGSFALSALVRVTLADGRLLEALLTPSNPSLVVPPFPRRRYVVRDYAAGGAERVLFGPDVVLFIFGLVLLAGTTRRIVGAISAFTLSHSIALSVATLAAVNLPSRWVEVATAATLLALAVALARPPSAPSLIRRRPSMMAALCGLLYGIGFAAALRATGLPEGAGTLALLSFNAGIELAQLLLVLAIVALGRAAATVLTRIPTWAHQLPAYGVGSLASYWWFQRMLALMR
jgi:hypothetical protein